MTSIEIDQLFKDWLAENRPPEIADQYETNSLLTPATNPPELNDAIDDMLGRLSRHFGAGESFMSTDYHEARAALGLPDDRTPLPEVFDSLFDSPSVQTRQVRPIS
jgi:hypothetical protein